MYLTILSSAIFGKTYFTMYLKLGQRYFRVQSSSISAIFQGKSYQIIVSTSKCWKNYILFEEKRMHKKHINLNREFNSISLKKRKGKSGIEE